MSLSFARAADRLHAFAGQRHALAIVFAIALAARLAVALVMMASGPDYEIWEYGRQGLCAAQTSGDLCLRDEAGAPYLSAYMPPLLSYVWMALFSIAGEDAARTLFILLNVIAGAACAPLLLTFGRKAGFGDGASLLGALLLALYPTFVFVSAGYHTTNFTVALLLGFALAVLAMLRSEGWRAPLLAGVLCGLCALTRTEALFAGAGAALLLAWRERKHFRRLVIRGAALAIGATLVIAPWAARNYVVFDRVIPVAHSQGYNLWKAFGPFASGSGNQVETSATSRAEIERIRASVPSGDAPGDRYENRLQDAFASDTERAGAHGLPELLALIANKIVLFWLFDWTDDLTHNPAYWAPWLLVNALAAFGLLALLRRSSSALPTDTRHLIIMLLTAFTIAYAIAGVHARYRMHIEPFLFLFAGAAAWRLVRPSLRLTEQR